MKWTITRSIAASVAALLLSITCLTIGSMALTATADRHTNDYSKHPRRRNTAVKISFLFIKKRAPFVFQKGALFWCLFFYSSSKVSCQPISPSDS